MLDVRSLSKFEVQCDAVGWSSSQQQHIDHVHVWIFLVSNALQGDSNFWRYPYIQWLLVMKPEKNTHKEWALQIQWKEEMLVERSPNAYSDPGFSCQGLNSTPYIGDGKIPPSIWNPYSNIHKRPTTGLIFPSPIWKTLFTAAHQSSVDWTDRSKFSIPVGLNALKLRAQILGG